MTPTEIETKLSSIFTPCGLNADWCVSAWHILGTTPNVGKGVYLLDQEDGTFTLTWRQSDGGVQDALVELASFTASEVASALCEDHEEDSITRIRAIARSLLCNHFYL